MTMTGVSYKHNKFVGRVNGNGNKYQWILPNYSVRANELSNVFIIVRPRDNIRNSRFMMFACGLLQANLSMIVLFYYNTSGQWHNVASAIETAISNTGRLTSHINPLGTGNIITTKTKRNQPIFSWKYMVGLWASCQMRKFKSCACAGNAGNVFPATMV